MRRAHLIVVLLLPVAIKAETVIGYSDSIFKDADWTTEIVAFSALFAAAQPSFEVNQEIAEGNPDAFRRTRTIGSNSAFSIAVGHILQIAVIDPRVDTIQSFDMFFDIIGLPQGAGDTGFSVYAPIIEQDGAYFGPTDRALTNGNWSAGSFLGLTQNDLTDYNDFTTNPDFSNTGGVISFGYAVRAGNSNGGFDELTGLDNWVVNATTTPAPAIIPLPAGVWGLLAAISLIFKAHRKKLARNHRD
ncbi:MAG: hypothetical protein AAF387_00400 [Pseudomonadota bacterium]